LSPAFLLSLFLSFLKPRKTRQNILLTRTLTHGLPLDEKTEGISPCGWPWGCCLVATWPSPTPVPWLDRVGALSPPFPPYKYQGREMKGGGEEKRRRKEKRRRRVWDSEKKKKKQRWIERKKRGEKPNKTETNKEKERGKNRGRDERSERERERRIGSEKERNKPKKTGRKTRG
jgi:hypothetical protein